MILNLTGGIPNAFFGDLLESNHDDAAADQTKSELAQHAARIKVVAAEEKDHERNDGNERQERIVAPEKAPGCARISPKHELEKTLDDDFLLNVTEGMQHDLLGDLVESNHEQGDYGNSAIRGPKHGRYGSHFRNQWALI